MQDYVCSDQIRVWGYILSRTRWWTSQPTLGLEQSPLLSALSISLRVNSRAKGFT